MRNNANETWDNMYTYINRSSVRDRKKVVRRRSKQTRQLQDLLQKKKMKLQNTFYGTDKCN